MDNIYTDYIDDGKPFTSISYTNGPGFKYHHRDENGNLMPRRNLSIDEAEGKLGLFYNFLFDLPTHLYVSSVMLC